MTYVDGFLLAVPKASKNSYISLSEKVATIYKKHGALSVCECWGDDLPEGEINSMHTAVMRKPDEAVVFSWVIWPDKAVRDNVHDKIVETMHEELGSDPVPFDGSRMIFGGFDVILDQ